MSFAFDAVGKGKIFSLDQARAMKRAAEELPPLPELPLADLGAGMSRALTPWRIVPSLENRCAIFDAENGFVTLLRSDIAHRVVEAMNEVEGRIAK